ncbi:MAG: IS5 family transposase [Chloroflexia bacterium]|nr:IS5 family transposase [Chloroflexia bacterium]
MRGDATKQTTMLLAVTPDQLVPADHPIRRVKPIVERALRVLSPTFSAMYAATGRPSIPPEHLLKGSLLIALYSIRSERQFCERLQYDLLFKWFLDLNITDPAFDASTFAKNRERLLEHDVAAHFFDAVLAEAQWHGLLSDEHFTVDGTLLESWASIKSFRPLGGGRNPDVDFHGQKRSNATHASTTDPDARLARKGKGKEAKLCLAGHVLMENRHGLAVDVLLTHATGTAEREAALRMLDRQPGPRHRVTLGADKNYDTRDFVRQCRARQVTPHVSQNTSGRRSAIDGRTTRHPGYAISQRIRKRVEEIFGWTKTVGGGRKLRYLGLARNQCWAELTTATYNLVRIANLLPAAT